MNKFWTRAVSGAAALVCASAANAFVIDFENVDYTYAPFAPLLADGEAVVQGSYFVSTQDLNGGGGLIGQLSVGSDPTSCLNGTCPSGNSSTFLSVYNDGLAHIGLLSGQGVVFGGLSAAYIATPGNPAGSTVYLAIEADRADGSYAAFYYPLLGNGSFQTIGATGGFSLGGQSTGTLTSGNVTDIFVYSYFCNGATGSCGAFKTDLGQFALDNISLTAAVPEPSEWMLMLAGLGAVGAVARRRRSV